MKLLILLMVIWNLIAFVMMGMDKRRAIKDQQRISEKTLLTSAFIMGAVGIGAGMLVFHHKTAKTRFRIGLPLALIVNAAVIYGLIYFGIV
mgnify:CR=1 FL=1